MADIDGGEVLFTIRGDASQLEAELGRARDGLEDLEGAADDTSGGLEGMGRQAGRVNTAMRGLSRGGISGLGAAVRLVNPQLGSMISSLGTLHRTAPQLGATLKALPAALGPVGIAAGVAAAAFGGLTLATKRLGRELDEMEAKVEASGNISTKAAAISLDLKQTMSDLRQEYGLLTGDISETDVQMEVFNASMDEQAQKYKDYMRELGKGDRDTLASIDARFQNAKDLNEQLQLERQAQQDLAEGYRQQAQAEDDAAAAARQRAAEAAKAAAEEAARLREASAQFDEVIAKNEQMASELSASMDQFIADTGAALDAAEELIIADQEAIAGGISDTLTGVSRLSSTLSEELAENNLKAARRLFRVSQATALTDVAMSTGAAIMKALQQLGPVAGAVAAGGIGTLGAAQAATILSQKPPSEHIGSGMPGNSDPLAPDERLSGARRILAQELSGPGGTVNSMGSSMVNDLNSGRLSGGGGQITAVIGRTHLDQELFQSGRRGTSRYARQLRTNPHPKPNRGW